MTRSDWLAVVVLLAVSASCAGYGSDRKARPTRTTTAGAPPTGSTATSSTVAASSELVVVATGDIACDPDHRHYRDGVGASHNCHQKATADLVRAQAPDAVLPLGDIQYESGTLDAFRASFDRTWGALKPLMRPVPGNHEYVLAGAPGYFDYFGAAAGPPGTGYYSYDIGSWHFIALNSNCTKLEGGCDRSGAQATWLRADLASHLNRCTLAYWHHPRFSSGIHGSDQRTDRLWRALHEGGADVVLVAHDHDYERFAPQGADGRLDPDRGMREFVVGTGGRSHDRFAHHAPNSEVRNDDTFGVLRLSLHDTGYDWRFVPEPKKTFTDAGTAACH
jgi:hypothetical protein